MLCRLTFTLFLVVSLSFSISALASQIDEDQAGAWYMYFFNKDFSHSRFGFQGDIQYRNWDMGGDLEQLLVRGGLTYRPEKLPGKYTLGVANITSGQFGRSDRTTSETRIYQEALIPQKLGSRVFLRHRIRFEQRWVENQDFRTRLRYGLFADVPLNQPTLTEGAWYLAFYNELFVNGERDIGGGRQVDFYDRNRFYTALGYKLSDRGQIQVGYMQQHTEAVNKGQFQISFHQAF